MDDAEMSPVPKADVPSLLKQEIASTHALGLQDLYKAAFSQEPGAPGYNDFNHKTTIISASLIHDDVEGEVKFFGEGEVKISEELGKPGSNFDESYQLYTLKGLQYAVDFVKPEEGGLELSYEEGKEGTEALSGGEGLNRGFEGGFPADGNSVLDLDKGIQIQLVKAEEMGVAPPQGGCGFETYEYTGDPQILHRYLCDTAMMKGDGGEVGGTVVGTLNLMSKQNNNVVEKLERESVGVNPEVLGVRFEDCDFNSSDSFASTESIIPKNIKCPKCPKKFMFKSDLLRHDKYKHSVKLKLFCKYCNKEFVSQQNLFFHEKSHKKKRNSYKCDTCMKVFKKSAVLLKHMMKKHGQERSPKWSNVIAIHSNDPPPFNCGQCDKTFSSQALLTSHIRKAHAAPVPAPASAPPPPDKPFRCDVCSRCFEKKQGLSCHAKAHIDNHPFICQHCNKTFSKECYLKNHQRSHCNEDKETFGKDLKTSNALEDQARKHAGDKPFTCNICMKSFACKAYFKVHIKKHADVRPFSCSHCQKGFVTASELTKHEKTHAKKKACQCSLCGQEFSQQAHLAAHLKKQKCAPPPLKSQEVCTQTTTDYADGHPLQNLTLQNVNVIVDQTFGLQQPIVLTSIGSFIDSNSVPVILTQNPSGPYSVPSIT